MGNQQSSSNARSSRYKRSRTIDANKPKNQNSFSNARKFTPVLNNQSLNQGPSKRRSYDDSGIDDDLNINSYQQPRKKYNSIDYSAKQKYPPKSNNSKIQRGQNDKTLQTLSKRNEDYRRQLKKINDELTAQLKKKKFVPKKKGKASRDDDDDDEQNNQRQNIGLKRQLQNGYKQIEMYKRTIQNLRGKEEGDLAQLKLRRLQNSIVDIDKDINIMIKKIDGTKKIKHKQDNQLDKQITDELKDGVATYKQQVGNLKKKLLQYTNRDRQRQGNYKKQQAYLCDLQKKLRSVNGQYFPQLKKATKKDNRKTSASDKSNIDKRQFYQTKQQADQLRAKHQQYNKRINVILRAKNDSLQEQNDLKQQIAYKQRIIQALKKRLDNLKKLTKPRKKNLFGGYANQGSQLNSQYNDNTSQLQRIQLQLKQNDQFDIKHLIANIPKPPRKRPQQISRKSSQSSQGRKNGKKLAGMVITSQRDQPKIWGSIQTRTQQRGKHFKGQLDFQDKAQFDGDVQPLVVGINIWVNKNNTILAIQAIYLNNNQLRYGVKSSDAADGVIKRFDLQSPDYVKNITFTSGPQGFVQSMALFSKQGQVAKFGNKRQYNTSYNFGLSGNQRPYLFFGASSLYQSQPRLNAIGIEICSE